MEQSALLLRWLVVILTIVGRCNVVSKQALTLNVDPKATTLFETETASVDLTTATCTTSGASCRVSIHSISPSSPCGSCFAVYPCAGGFCLRFMPGQGSLSAMQTSRYSVTLKAVDDDLNQVTTVVDVHIRPNQPPYFDVEDFSEKTLHETTSLTNEGFFTVPAKEPEADPLSFTMSTVPETDILQIDSLSGILTATRDVKTACMAGVTGLVYVQDQFHNEPAGPLALSVDFTEANDRPLITNLNTEIQVREDTRVGETVLRLAAHDGKTSPPNHLIYTVHTVPATASNLFEIYENEVMVKSELDYERFPNPITLSIRASDGYCDSDLYTLPIQLVNINESPFLFPVDQTLDSCEGLVDIRPTWTNVSDPDENDSVKFSLVDSTNINGRFKIDETTGMVSTAIDYDLDEGKLPATAVLSVALTDRQGQSATATLTIRFVDCNDNAPIFGTSARAYLARDCWPAGSVLGTVPRATDADSSFRQNNVFSHSGSAPGVYVQESGSIVITEQFKAGQTVTFPVYATDKGEVPGPLTSRPFYASIYTLPCLTPPTTEAPIVDPNNDRSIHDEPNTADFWQQNLGWIIAGVVLSFVMLPCFMLTLWRYCWPAVVRCCGRMHKADCCRTPNTYRKQSVPKVVAPARRPTPPPQRPGPGFIFGWWKETYPDNDYKKTPNRQAQPEPSKGPQPVETNTYDFSSQIPPAPKALPKKLCRLM